MYPYSCPPPWMGIWPPSQALAYTYLPAPLLLPRIQSHSFCSGLAGLSAGEWAAPREYHCFYCASAPLPPWWAIPPASAAALRPQFPGAGVLGPSSWAPPETRAAESWAPWPEGGSLQVELRWGRVERALGPPLELPDFVRRELRRVYGTYPHTDVRITCRRGEFLLQAAPHVGEPEVRVQRRVLRRPASRDSSPAGEAAERGRPRKRKGQS